jgi:acyl carrier protein
MGKPNSGEAFGRIEALAHEEGADEHPFASTVLLDGCLHVFGAALDTYTEQDFRGAFVPVSIKSVTLRRELPSKVWSHATVRTNPDGRAALAQIRVYTDAGEVIAEIDGLELRKTTSLGKSREQRSESSGTTESGDQLIKRLREMPEDNRVEAVAKWIASDVKEILGEAAAEELDLDNLDPSTAFLEIGLDSLLVTELQRRIQEEFDFRFEPMQGLDYQSIESLAEYILNDVLRIGQPSDPTEIAEPAVTK